MDITNVKRETLAKQYDEAKAKYIAAKETLNSDFAKVFHEWFVEKGIDEFCSFNAEDEGDGCVFVTDGHENFGIPVRYYKRWKEDGSARYELTMNYSCFGSFASDNVAMVRFATVIGKLAEDLANLQNRLSKLNWIHVRELQKIYSRAEGALEEYDAEVETAEPMMMGVVPIRGSVPDRTEDGVARRGVFSLKSVMAKIRGVFTSRQ